MRLRLAENIRACRKERKLTQEKLAEALGVTPGAVHKWESGQSVPESDKLLAVSRHFDVSLDYLMKDEILSPNPKKTLPSPEAKEDTPPPTEAHKPRRDLRVLGLVLCFSGVLCLILWGILSTLAPSVSQQITESSVIRLDGSGILFMLCVASLILGAMLLLKHTPR